MQKQQQFLKETVVYLFSIINSTISSHVQCGGRIFKIAGLRFRYRILCSLTSFFDF